MKCVICKKQIEKQYTEDGEMFWDQGEDARPIGEGRCCLKCNKNIVIPARIEDIIMSKKNE